MRVGIAHLKRGLVAPILFALGASNGIAAGPRCASVSTLLVPTNAAERPYVEHYNALVAEDPYSLSAGTAPRWRRLVDDLRVSGAPFAILRARSEMMLARVLKDDAADAGLVAARDALALAEANGVTEGSLHAALLATLAASETEAGDTMAAAAHADAALAETARFDGKDNWAYGRAANIGSEAYYQLGEYGRSEELSAVAEGLASACLPPGAPIIGAAINSHAMDLVQLGRIDDGLVENERAVAWEAANLQPGDPSMARGLAGLGWNLFLAGRLREAEAVMRRSIDLNARYQPGDVSERALDLFMFGNILFHEGKFREAETIWAVDADLYARDKSRAEPLAGNGLLRRLADNAQRLGKLDEAVAFRQRAVALLESRAQPRHLELARARIEYAATLVVAGRVQEALAIAEPAIAILRDVAPPDDFKRTVNEVTYAWIARRAGGDPVKAYATAEPAAARMEKSLLDSATMRGALVQLAPSYAASFGTAAELALAAGRDDAAFRWLQLANFSSVALVDREIATRAAAANPATRAAVISFASLVRDRKRLDRDRVRAAATQDAAQLAKIDAAIRASDVEMAATTSQLDRMYPAFRRLARPTPVALDGFRARLGANDVLIAPVSLADETVTVAVTREGLTWSSSPVPGYKLQALIARIRMSIDASRADAGKAFDVAAAQDLYRAILPPALAPTLRSHRHILYYGAGSLATVQPALLVEQPPIAGAPTAWLVRSHSISVLPTLDQRRVSGATSRGFLGVGAPLLKGKVPRVFERGASIDLASFGLPATSLPALPQAASELRTMAASFPPTGRRLLLGKAATERAIKALALDRIGTIAIATHSLMRDALPGLAEPALVLTPPGAPDEIDDGLLTASEIANLRLDADLVILSACDTAGGSDPEDASYTGLARAFFEAGARALLVSHWAVRDDAAARLTVATVRETRRGVDRATALQHAMLVLMRDRSIPGAANPAVWAPFVLVE